MNRKGIWIGVGVAVAVILIAVQLLGSQQGSPDGRISESGAPYWEGLPTAGLTIGPADAPVLVEEYFDFQCPHCQTSSHEVVKPFIERVVAEGRARFAYRLFPILGPESVTAARGAYCAAKQGMFWPFQDVLFAVEGTGNRGTYSEPMLGTYAERANLDVDLFETCLAGDEAATYVAGAYERGVQLGLPGTPVYFVNGQPVSVGSFNDLRRAVEEVSGSARDGA